MNFSIKIMLQLAGILQVLLSIGSLVIPRLLNWKEELAKLSRILSQMFWTYAGYILVINLSFGLLSFFGAESLLDKSFLAKAVSVFIFLYWFVRVLIQAFYFDTTAAPKGAIYKAGEIGLNCLFVYLTLVYAWVSYLNFSQQLAVALFFILVLSIPLWGYLVLNNNTINPVLAAWMLTLACIGIIHLLIPSGPVITMLLLIMSTFLSLKIVVAHNHLGKEARLSFRQWLLFCYGWFGMNPKPFLAFPSPALEDHKTYLIRGISRIVVGICLINATSFIERFDATGTYDFIFHLLYLVGLSLILHFGILNMATGILRRTGVNVGSLFKDPARSQSLNEFWSKRWNIAFVELTTIAVTRPVRAIYGPTVAFWVSFIFSGLLHEMAISLPVRAGFGKPFLYFLIQAVLVLSVDRFIITRTANKLMKTFFVLTCLILPIFLLFHEPFIQGIVLAVVRYLIIV